ncbi:MULTISPECIES: LysE/ArgO family amino acid transporter [Bacillus]|uniref:LysE/ArgO family amino acid transporter n=1 Tax=Bacillus TaxID=1386 RepID=UPI0002D3BF40|nr:MULTISPECIES: LysE/ArgO family amino acid transporter [Bacillus]
MFTAIIHGIILAFGLIIPLGAQNIFIFNQGATQPSFKKVLPVILTASLCDTLLILLAVLGVSVIVLTIPILQTTFFIIGILFLLYMGWTIWNSQSSDMNQQASALSAKKQILFAMSVSLLNPHAILDTIGVIGTSSLNYSGIDKICFTVATIFISWLWFFSLAIVGKKVGEIDQSGNLLNKINKVSAIIIWGVAIYLGYQLL